MCLQAGSVGGDVHLREAGPVEMLAQVFRRTVVGEELGLTKKEITEAVFRGRDRSNVIGRVGQAQVTAARQDLLGIEGALKLYRLDNFNYPTTEQGLEALVTKPADPGLRNWKGSYLPRTPKDPWGIPYLYLNPGNNGEIDVYTLGRDGQPGGDDEDADIGNWDGE